MSRKKAKPELEAARRAAPPDVPGAEWKLRQAQFFLNHLQHAAPPTGSEISGEALEALKNYFSACLSATQSAFYTLTASGEFEAKKRAWLSTLTGPERSEFWEMKDLRDIDVHYAVMDAKALSKMIPADLSAPLGQGWGRAAAYTHYQNFSSAPDARVRHPNPDGTVVEGAVLRGTMGLYLEWGGRPRVEATTVCREFIARMSALVEYVKSAP
jgi:hypothetical protein